MTAPVVLLAADARPQSGGGHLARLRTLAEALEAHGATVRLMGRDADDFSQVVEAAEAVDVGLVVLDDYGATIEDDLRLKQKGRRLAALCDGPTGQRAPDLILDAAPRPHPAAYTDKAPNAKLLLGPQWALVGECYTTRRSASLARRSNDLNGRARLAISFGLVDRPGGALLALEAVRMLEQEGWSDRLTVDLVIGPHCQHAERLQREAQGLANASVLTDPPDLAERLAAADLAIGHCGVSSWERAVLGLPAVALVNADNQEGVAAALRQRGAAAWLRPIQETRAADIATEVRFLLENDDARRAMSSAAAELVDGQGAQRAARALSALLEEER